MVKILLTAVEDIFMMRIACHYLLRICQCCEIFSKTHAKDHQSSFYLRAQSSLWSLWQSSGYESHAPRVLWWGGLLVVVAAKSPASPLSCLLLLELGVKQQIVSATRLTHAH